MLLSFFLPPNEPLLIPQSWFKYHIPFIVAYRKIHYIHEFIYSFKPLFPKVDDTFLQGGSDQP